jgi:hypothetical protein
MSKYRKKPIEVEAEQFFAAEKPWPEGVYAAGSVVSEGQSRGVCFRVDTLEGPLRVSEGDWIITGIKGERYPCKPDIFEATYERVGT